MALTADEVKIGNITLSKLGQPSVSAGDGSTALGYIEEVFAHHRDVELATNLWGFAIERTIIAAAETAPAFGWAYKYALPADYLRFVELPDLAVDDIPGREIEGGYILTDLASPIKLRYMKKQTDPTKWPIEFADVMACKLAFELCEKFKQDQARKNTLMQEYSLALGRAKKTNALQMPARILVKGRWVAAHNG